MARFGRLDEQENFDDNPKLAEKMALLNPSLLWYFFLSGQWFAPVKDIIKKKNLPRTPFRVAYSIWQGIVVVLRILDGTFQPSANAGRSGLAVPANGH